MRRELRNLTQAIYDNLPELPQGLVGSPLGVEDVYNRYRPASEVIKLGEEILGARQRKGEEVEESGDEDEDEDHEDHEDDDEGEESKDEESDDEVFVFTYKYISTGTEREYDNEEGE